MCVGAYQCLAAATTGERSSSRDGHRLISLSACLAGWLSLSLSLCLSASVPLCLPPHTPSPPFSLLPLSVSLSLSVGVSLPQLSLCWQAAEAGVRKRSAPLPNSRRDRGGESQADASRGADAQLKHAVQDGGPFGGRACQEVRSSALHVRVSFVQKSHLTLRFFGVLCMKNL